MATRSKSRADRLRPSSARKAISPSAAVRPPAAGDASVQISIERAKLDWESTVDALAELVCLLGRDGAIMRTNRAVEDWSLGTVAGVLGKHAHSVLHAGCRNKNCGIAGFLKHALGEIRRGLATLCVGGGMGIAAALAKA